MANGRFTLGKQSGGTLGLVFPDGVSNTEVVLPESGELATILSPALTGVPTAPTAAVGTNNTQIATTAFVQANKTAVNASSVATATAGIAEGSIGSYVFAAQHINGNKYFGATVAGSLLNAGSIVRSGSSFSISASETTLSGTWRCLGHAGFNQTAIQLYLRIA